MVGVDANEVLVIGYKVSFFHHSMYQCCLGAFQNHDGLLCLQRPGSLPTE
jgi:hypothetical protein